MKIEEITNGLKFIRDMFLFDPSTGEIISRDSLNEDNRTTVDALDGAIAFFESLADTEYISKDKIQDSITDRLLDCFHQYLSYDNCNDIAYDIVQSATPLNGDTDVSCIADITLEKATTILRDPNAQGWQYTRALMTLAENNFEVAYKSANGMCTLKSPTVWYSIDLTTQKLLNLKESNRGLIEQLGLQMKEV